MFAERLPDLVGTASAIYLPLYQAPLYAPPGLSPPLSVPAQIAQSIAARLPGKTVADLTPLVVRMRLVKDSLEIASLRRTGDLMFIDCGAAEFNTYTSDLCRTFSVSGKFSAEQRKYYEIVLEAQEAAIAAIRPGVMMLDVIKAAAQVFRRHDLEPNEDVSDLGHHIELEEQDSRDISLEKGIAIMLEDVIAVTATGHDNLSAGSPKTVADIEKG